MRNSKGGSSWLRPRPGTDSSSTIQKEVVTLNQDGTKSESQRGFQIQDRQNRMMACMASDYRVMRACAGFVDARYVRGDSLCLYLRRKTGECINSKAKLWAMTQEGQDGESSEREAAVGGSDR